MAATNPSIKQEEPVNPVNSEIENKLQATSTHVEKGESGSESEPTKKNDAAPEQHMTTTIWLACIALGLSYSTAFQQNACTTAIVKHIDTELGLLLCRT